MLGWHRQVCFALFGWSCWNCFERSSKILKNKSLIYSFAQANKYLIDLFAKANKLVGCDPNLAEPSVMLRLQGAQPRLMRLPAIVEGLLPLRVTAEQIVNSVFAKRG